MDQKNSARTVSPTVPYRNRHALRRSLYAGLLGALPLCWAPSLVGLAFAQQPETPATATPPAVSTQPPPVTQAAPAAPSGAPVVAQINIKTTSLAPNVYMLEGRGGNVTVAVGNRYVLVVDGQFADMYDKIRGAIRPLSNAPVRYLINTHYHGDHTGGNASFTKDGTTVVSQDNVKKRLAAGTINEVTGGRSQPVTGGGLPSRTYARALNLRLGGLVAHLNHIPNAHTDGDTYVWLKLANVLSTGDTFINGRYPTIDVSNGGNIKGMIAATERYISLANNQTKVVPGHGPLSTEADLIAYRNMLVTARDRVAALIKQGKSLDEVIAAKPMADFDAKMAASPQAGVNFLKFVYVSLKPAAMSTAAKGASAPAASAPAKK